MLELRGEDEEEEKQTKKGAKPESEYCTVEPAKTKKRRWETRQKHGRGRADKTRMWCGVQRYSKNEALTRVIGGTAQRRDSSSGSGSRYY